MKIIKPGKQLAEREMEGTCTECGCQIECVQTETREVDGRNDMLYRVQCPTCKGSIWCRHKQDKSDT
jgi:hypothetical protein